MDGKITYHQQVSYCGKPRCRRCREGIGHGPYWYAYQTVNGRTVRTYIGKEAPPEVLVATRAETSVSSSPEFASTLLRLCVLGQFRLEQRANGQNSSAPHWEPVTEASLQHQRVRSLLSCLVSSPGRKLGREQVMYALWQELDLEIASHRLDRAVHSLRQVFEPGRSRPASSRLLLTEHATLTLADQSQFWIDADAFENLISQGRVLQDDDPGRAERLMEEAMELYGGDFIPGEESIEWVTSRRESLRRSWISLLLELADLRLAREALTAALDVLDRLLGADPTNEAAVQRMIALQAQMGRRGEALQVYERFVDLIRQRYMIEPLAETRALYDRVRTGMTPAFNPSSGRIRPGTGEAGSGSAPWTSATRSGRGGAVAGELSEAGGADFTPGGLPVVGPAHMHIGRTQQSPLVGRGQEMRRLYELLSITEGTRRQRLAGEKRSSLLTPLDLSAQRRPQCVVLMGDVGIGKTRLAEEAAREAKRHNWAVAWCRAYTQESSVPYRLWTETLRKAMTQGLWQRNEVTRRPLIYQPLRSLLPELQDLLPHSMQMVPPPPEQEQLRLWESTRALLSTICEGTTLLIVLDDVQWADSSSCEMLIYLVRQMRGHPVMFLCTCRDSELPAGHHLRPLLTDLQREQAVEIVPVTPLSDREIREMLAYLPVSVIESISERASGNPFFAEELARSLAGASDTANPDVLPDTIQAVLDLRLARISDRCRHILERGAVLGGAFQFDAIRDMASVSEDEILDILEEGLQAGMLTEEGSGMRITYHFWHPLLQAYLYEHLSHARRANLHRRAAQALQNLHAGDETAQAAEIADHLVKGGAAPSLVARYAELAADHAYSLSAYAGAEKYYRLVLQHSLDLTSDSPQEGRLHRAYVLERLGECAMIVGKFEEARVFYEQVLDVRSKCIFVSCEEKRYEAQLRALIWCDIGKTWHYAGESSKAKESFKHGEQELNAADILAGPAWAMIRYEESYNCWREGSLTEAINLAHTSLELFEASANIPLKFAAFTRTQQTLNGDPVDLGRVYTLLGVLEITIGQSTEALNHLNAALTIYERYNRQREIAIVCTNQGDIYLKRSSYALAQTAFMRTIGIAEQVGDIPSISVGLGNLGVLAARLGNLSEAEQQYRKAVDLAEQVNDPFFMSLWRSYMTHVLLCQGKIDDAISTLYNALKIGRSMRIAPCIGLALISLGRVRLVQALSYSSKRKDSIGTSKKISRIAYLSYLNRARNSLTFGLGCEGLETENKIDGQLTLAEVHLLLGNVDAAYEQASQNLAEAQRYGLVWLVAKSQAALGHVLVVQHKNTEAIEYFQKAWNTFESTGMHLEYARVSQAYALLLLQSSKGAQPREQALQYLQEARQIFQEHGAALDVQVLEQELALVKGVRAEEATPRTGVTLRSQTR
jgi:DNA-binding SARP family transcriptional activator